jgi:hypothetical protein
MDPENSAGETPALPGFSTIGQPLKAVPTTRENSEDGR